MIYVLDENGSLFYQQDVFHDVYSLVKHMQQFFSSVHKRMNFLNAIEDNQAIAEWVQFYKIESSEYDGSYLEQHSINRYVRPSQYISLQVIGDKIDGAVVFTIYCQEREFSSLEYGEKLYIEVAKHILNKRSSGGKYPIYITDLDLSKSLLDMDMRYLQTFHYLKYKKEIEHYLSVALEALA